MNKINFVFVFLAVFLFVGCTTTQKPAELKNFTSEDGRFSILLPDTPKFETHNLSSAVGPVVSKSYIVDDLDMSYGVTYTDYPSDVVERTDPQKMLDGARDGGISNSHGELVTEKNISLNGYPGREMTISVRDIAVRSRVYIVKNRLYSVLASGPIAQLYLEPAVSILDSFNLTG